MSPDESGDTQLRPQEPAQTPPPEYQSRTRESERTTRKPMQMWDRVKILALLLGVWGILVWAARVQHPDRPLSEALRSGIWLLVLAELELIRQVHYLICEHWAGYYRFWNKGVFGTFESRSSKMDDWTRFRLARVAKVLFFLLILDLVLSATLHLSPALALFQAPALAMAGLPFVFQLAFGFFFIVFQFIGLFWFLSKGGVDTYMPDDIETRFTDVKGQDSVLNHVKENMIFLEDPESIEERGGYVPGGVLLWGPPGTGKTLMAQAVAGETAKPFVFVDPGAFIQMFMGVGILKVKGLYRKLRRLAVRYGGVIVFFDEADSLGNRGGGGGGVPPGGNIERSTSPWSTMPGCNGLAYASPQARDTLLRGSLRGGVEAPPHKEAIIAGLGGMGGGNMGTLQALLSEMSGLKKPRGFFNRTVRRLFGLKPKPPPKYRILHIFATNRADVLDEALLRPGRVDRIYKVGYPLKEGRKATFDYYLAKVKNQLTEEQVEKLAVISPYATGASIQDMVNEALVIAIRSGRDSISWRDIIDAKRIKQHGLPDDHEYIERERHSIAIHEACHAVVAYRLRRHAIIDIATIERRGDVGGFVASIPPEDQFVEWRTERETDVMTFLASLAGERLFFDGDHSTGVGGDMRGATALTTQMAAFYAMGGSIASRSINLGAMRGAPPAETGADRALFDSEFGKRVEAKLDEMYERTWELLEDNRADVLSVAHALEVHKTLTGDDVAAIIEGEIGPFIDGRPYKDPNVVRELEAYHTAAVAAHRAHSSVEAPMPVLPVYAGGNGQQEPAAAVQQAQALGDGESGPPPPPPSPAAGD